MRRLVNIRRSAKILEMEHDEMCRYRGRSLLIMSCLIV